MDSIYHKRERTFSHKAVIMTVIPFQVVRVPYVKCGDHVEMISAVSYSFAQGENISLRRTQMMAEWMKKTLQREVTTIYIMNVNSIPSRVRKLIVSREQPNEHSVSSQNLPQTISESCETITQLQRYMTHKVKCIEK